TVPAVRPGGGSRRGPRPAPRPALGTGRRGAHGDARAPVLRDTAGPPPPQPLHRWVRRVRRPARACPDVGPSRVPTPGRPQPERLPTPLPQVRATGTAGDRDAAAYRRHR